MFNYQLPLRYLIPLLLLLFSVITLFAGFVSGRSEMMNTVSTQIEEHFVQRLHLSQHILEQMLRHDNQGVISPYVSAFGMMRNNRLALLVSDEGVVIAATELKMVGHRWEMIGTKNDREFLQSIKPNSEKWVAQRDDEQLIQGYIKVCGSRELSGVRRQQCGFFYQSQDTSAATSAAQTAAMRQAAYTGVGALLATMLLALILYRLITRRSVYMIQVTQRFSNGDSRARTKMKGNDELASVGVALDSMFARIECDQQQLRDSQDSLNRAQKIAHLGNWEWDIGAATLRCSDEVFRIFGWLPQSFEPDYERFMAAVHPEDREKVQAAVAQIINDESAEYRVDHRVILEDGSVRTIQESGQVARNAEGHVVSIMGTVLDITERVKTEEELELFQLMIEKSADPVFLIDNDDNYRMAYVNEAAVSHFAAPRDEILRWRIPDWDPTISYDDLSRHHLTVEALPGTIIETVHRVMGGAVVPVEVSLNPIRYRGRNCHFGYIKDISERKEVERSLNLAREKAEEATRTKSEFLANMSHEIRTPMNAIINLSYLAQDSAELTGRTRDYLSKIESSANHLLGIINDVLDFSKIEAGKLALECAPFSLQKILGSLATVIGYRMVEKNIEVLFHVAPQTPDFLCGDALRLSQILTNLLSNAIKFTDEGEVVLSVHAEPPHEGRVRFEFVVRDTGRGMSEKEQLGLFQAFTQTDSSISRQYGGTGLGLVITRRLVELMGGTISVDSYRGEGSRFSVSLDLELSPEDSTQRFADGCLDLSRMRVLVVDDNETARQIFSENFESFGVAAVVLSTVEALVQELQQHNCGGATPYEAVILDWKMRGMNGVETAHYIRHDLGLTTLPKIMICTAYGVEATTEITQAGAVSGALSKPFSPSSLLDALMDMMGCSSESTRRTSSVLTQELKAALDALKGSRILVVEDNEINQEIARALLEKVGMAVTVASLASEAFKVLEEKQFDLVLMDIQMPEMDGLEATRFIRSFSHFATLPIVAMTAHAMGRDRELSLSAGMNDHLTKPINPSELYRMIIRWLSHDQPASLPGAAAPQQTATSEAAGTGVAPLYGIDSDVAMHRLAGNHVLYRQLLHQFRERSLHADAAIQECIAAGRITEARELVHGIKGVAGNLGATALFELATQLEYALHDNSDIEHVTPLLNAYAAEHRQVMSALEATHSEPVESDSVSREMERERVLSLLQDLMQNIETDLGQGMQTLEQLGPYLRGTSLDEAFTQLEQAVSDFNTDRVTECLSSIYQQIEGMEV